MRVVDLDLAGRRVDDGGEDALWLRRSDRRQLDELPAARDEIEDAAPVREGARVDRVAETGGGEGVAPDGRRARADLLKGDDVRLLARNRFRLRGEHADPPRHVPGEQLHLHAP